MRRRGIEASLLAVIVSWLIPFAPAASAQAIAPEMQTLIDGLGPDETVSVIVRFKQSARLQRFRGLEREQLRTELVTELKARASESRSRVARILSGPGIVRQASLWAINGQAITANAEVIRSLARRPTVESIYLDAVIQEPPLEVGLDSTAEWNLTAMRAPELWSLGYAGGGVVVASMDTGVDLLHQDLVSRYRGGTNSWFDPNGQHATPYDKTGHGTQSMGLILGGDAGGSSIGVAPDAQWIAVKIFDDSGSASLSAIHQGFQWLLDPDDDPSTDDAADVVNNSWSLANEGGCNLEFEQDIQILKTAQIAVVFAGGNYGPADSTSVSPANNPSGFAVGAVDDALSVDVLSSNGPSACDGSVYPDLVAPGIGVRTADLTFGAFPDSYTYSSGTSFSAPHVTGAMALLLAAHPEATVADLEQSLVASAIDLGATGPDNAYGNGLIDVVAAESWLADPPGPTCTDGDGDGFFVESDCGTALDCDDTDAGINPAACDIKNDGIDQDCDGEDRRTGKSCPPGGGDPGGDPGGGGDKGRSCPIRTLFSSEGQASCVGGTCEISFSCQ
jgi:bacillopeptidase F